LTDLKTIHGWTIPNIRHAVFQAFTGKMNKKYSPAQSALAASRGGGHPVFLLATEIRKTISIESMNSSLRKVLKKKWLISERQPAHENDPPADEEDRKKVDDAKSQQRQ
jgi:hypothetical protein